MVALQDAAHRKIKGFSGGMKRRVGIAQALVNDPKVVIVDEPTAGLDPEERIRFRNLLVKLSADRTVLLSTHIVEDVGQTCRDIAVLAKGHVWTITSAQLEEPKPGETIVSMLHLSDGIQYRMVAPDASAYPNAEPARPSLEDGYVWLMKTLAA